MSAGPYRNGQYTRMCGIPPLGLSAQDDAEGSSRTPLVKEAAGRFTRISTVL